jgi:2-O-methyltransferase
MNERECAVEIIAKAPGDHVTIVELGAHHGNDTVLLYDAARKPIRYLAIEADPRNMSILLGRIEQRKIDVLHAAVWHEPGMIELHLSNGNGNGSSSVRKPLEHLNCFPDISFEETVYVPALTLDAIAQAYGLANSIIDLIWCDIQGAERNMITGGRKTLACTRWLLTECDTVEMYEGQATRNELLAMLEPDWELVEEWPENANLLLQNCRLPIQFA